MFTKKSPAPIYPNMPQYAPVCPGMPRYAPVCPGMPLYGPDVVGHGPVATLSAILPSVFDRFLFWQFLRLPYDPLHNMSANVQHHKPGYVLRSQQSRNNFGDITVVTSCQGVARPERVSPPLLFLSLLASEFQLGPRRIP